CFVAALSPVPSPAALLPLTDLSLPVFTGVTAVIPS
ncbi:unnamed protein product, partial [Ectocarpus fasciculatus]